MGLDHRELSGIKAIGADKIAVWKVRSVEARSLAEKGYETLKKTRWCSVKRPEDLTADQKMKLKDVLQYDLRTVRAYLHKEAFEVF